MKKLVFYFVVFMIFQTQILPLEKKLVIDNPWLRPAASGANTALFFDVINKGDKPDTLIAVKFGFSEVVELHETYKKSEDVMGMRSVKSVTIPPKTTVKFKPRDLHIMLISLKKDLRIDEFYEVVLVFKNAGELKVKAMVRDMPRNGMKK